MYSINLQAAEAVVLDAEGGVDDVGDVILQHPAEGGEEVRIHRLNVRQVDGLIQEHLVEGHREPAVNVMPVKDSNAWKQTQTNNEPNG
jgi:hypothetical protein